MHCAPYVEDSADGKRVIGFDIKDLQQVEHSPLAIIVVWDQRHGLLPTCGINAMQLRQVSPTARQIAALLELMSPEWQAVFRFDTRVVQLDLFQLATAIYTMPKDQYVGRGDGIRHSALFANRSRQTPRMESGWGRLQPSPAGKQWLIYQQGAGSPILASDCSNWSICGCVLMAAWVRAMVHQLHMVNYDPRGLNILRTGAVAARGHDWAARGPFCCPSIGPATASSRWMGR
jgi:hypothetical protein